MRRVPGTVTGLLLCGVFVTAARAPSQGAYTVAYASFGPLRTAVFIANADGTGERMLLEDPGLDSNPSFSPDGRWVFFTSRRNGSDDIYRIRTDGSNLERLTADPAFDDQAATSPDGRHVAFVSSRSGQADIWLLDLDTRQLRNLTNHPGGDYRPAWSPDGQWIAFTTDRDSAGARESTGAQFAPRQVTQIYIMRADGSALRRLTHGEDPVGGASWSPDGTAIAFYQAAPEDWQVLSRTFPGIVVRSQIATIDVATGATTALTSGSGRKLTPQWIARGRIAYVRADIEEQPGQQKRTRAYWSEGIRFTDGSDGTSRRVHERTLVARWHQDGLPSRCRRDLPPLRRNVRSRSPVSTRQDRILPFVLAGRPSVGVDDAGVRVRPNPGVVAASDGSNPRVLFNDPTQSALAPAWAPTGDRIAFGLGAFFPTPRRYSPAQIAIINGDGSGLRRLTPDDGGNYQFPSWSPDGKRLVLRAARADSKGLSILDVDSGTLTPLTPESGTDNLPAWSPAGDVITFTSRRDGDWEIYSIRPDGTGLKRLTRSQGNDAHASWSPDGRWIAFSSARGGFKDEMARGGGGGQGATDIFVMRPDGTDVRRLTDDATEEGTTAFAWAK